MRRHIYKYAGLTKLVYYAGTVEARLPDLGSLVWHIGLGYGLRLCLGYRSQLRGHIPTIKERTFQAWMEIMMTGCTMVV
jgi:hypothetical protein